MGNLFANLSNHDGALVRRLYRAAAVMTVCLLALSVASGSALARSSRSGAPDAGVININKASIEQLSYLPGIGQKKAERIVEYRTKRPFDRVVELARVKGIGLKTVRNLKTWLRVDGKTTLTGPVKLPSKD